MAVDSFDDELLQLKKRARWRLIGACALIFVALIAYSCLVGEEPAPKVEKNVRIETVASGAVTGSTPVAMPSASAVLASAARPSKKAASTATANPSASAIAAAAVKRAHQPSSSPAHERSPVSLAPTKPTVHTPVVKPVPTLSPATAPVVVKPAPAHKPAVIAPVVSKPSPPVAGATDENSAPTSVSPKQGRQVVQIAAFADAGKAKELLSKLETQGFRGYTDTHESNGKLLTRVRIGPFKDRAEAEKARAKVSLMGLNGMISGQ